MENLNLILFISIAIPMFTMLFICKGRSRSILGFMLIGLFVCLFSSELSGILFNVLPQGELFLTINITPFTEEVLKAIPLLIFIFAYKPEEQRIFESAIAIGVGFAILENAFILSNNLDSVNIALALIRGFGAGMMHALTTFSIGFGVCKMRKNKKAAHAGVIAMFCIAIMYHSLYNILVQSRFEIVGFILPIATFVPFLVILKKKKLL